MSSSAESDNDFELKDTKSSSDNEPESDISSISDADSDFQYTIKSKPKPNLKLEKRLDSDSYSNFETESPSTAELDLGSDSPDSISESPVESDNDQESDSESEINTDLSTSSFDVEPSLRIEKIIGINQPTFSEDADQMMYFVKYKNQSYQSCQWISGEDLLKTKHGKLMHTAFLKNPAPFKKVHFFNASISELFKPVKVKFDEGYIVPEKILSVQTRSESKKFLVKWISLDIKESTWENDVPDSLIEEYERKNNETHSANYDHSKNEDDKEFTPLTRSPKYRNFNKLFDFQLEALNFLLKNWFEKRNSILCDTKVMGRMIESIAFLQRLSKMCPSWSPFVVVCPSSSVNFWMNEFENWTEFRVVCLTGNKNSSQMVKKYMMFHHIDEENKLDVENIIYDVLIVSYESLSREITFLKKFNFMFAVFDEAHKIKNIETNIYQECMSIKAHSKLLLAGELNQYDLVDVWSLLHFISPSEFTEYRKFEKKCRNANYKDEIKQYILVRNEEDVNIKLPENEETIVESEMTHFQRDCAQTIVKNNLGTLSDISASKNKINSFLNPLHKILCHPFLVPDLEQDCITQFKVLSSIPKNSQLDSENEMNSIILSSGKMILFDKLIQKLREEKHKVLVYSSMQNMLDIIENYLISKEFLYERLDSQYSISKRTFSIERFQKFDEVFVILLSPESGGIGVDITGADTVLIYDGEYDPRNDILSQSKIHKNNRSKIINVIRLTTNGCYESEMLFNDPSYLNFESINNEKLLALFDENKSNEKSDKEMRIKLQKILRKSCYHIFNDNPDKIDILCTQSIDQILENRSHKKEEDEFDEELKLSKKEEKIINKKSFWDGFLHSETSSEVDDFDFNTGIKPRTKRRAEKRDEDEYDYNNNQNDQNGQTSSSSSTSDSSFSLSEDESDDSVQQLSVFPDSEIVKDSASELYTISLLNQSLFSQMNKASLSSSRHSSDSSDLETVESSDEINELNSATSELKDSVVQKIFNEALEAVRKHGIAGARLFTSDTFVEIGKTLVVLAYSKLPKQKMKKYKSYIREHVPRMSKQILKTPYKELSDEEFISSLFKGEELKIIKDCFRSDRIYKVALFVSTEKLPEKFLFAPELNAPLGWTAVDDFIALTASPLFDDISEIADDEKLPFTTVSKSFPSFKKWIKKRIELIVDELSIIVPSDFSVYERLKGGFIPKKFCDLRVFRKLNYHVICPRLLPINFQKKLLRVLYLYGLPQTEGVQKIKEVLKCGAMHVDDLIHVFIEKVLIRAIRFRPNLTSLLKSFGKVGTFSIKKKIDVDIRWISEEAIGEVASKLDLLYGVREIFNEKVKLNGLREWSKIKGCCNFWSPKCDKSLLRATACYGFLFNSMVCRFIPKIGVTDEGVIARWKEEENEALKPLLIPEVEGMEELFSVENRAKRIARILDFLESE